MEDAGIPNPYSRQGEEQPFGYTGYRRDDISGTYFAQAREYQPQNGRFTAEDVIKGNGAFPDTLNQYGYCLGNPMNLVDLNGLYPEWLYGIYAHMQFEVEFLMLYMEGFGSLACDDAYGDINVYIPGGGIIGKYGYADMVLYAEGKAHVYEIKPISYYNDESKKKVGEAQLESYVDALKVKGYNAVNGDPEYIDFLLFWNESFYFDSDMVIKYEMFEDSPGMIYYTLIDKEELRQSAPASQSVPYLELDEKTKQAITIVLVMGVAALALYMTMPEKSYVSCFA